MVYEVGDIVKLKKPHPCGSQEWEILRVGADFPLKCMGWGCMGMVKRRMVDKNTRGVRKADGTEVKSRKLEKQKPVTWDPLEREA